MFDPERKTMPLLKHPNIVTSFEIYGNGENGSVIIMDYLDGEDLVKTVLEGKNEKYPGGVVPKATTIDWLVSMAEAVKYMHTELYMVHRDLHWGNWIAT